MSFTNGLSRNQTVFTVNGRKMILWEDNAVRARKNFTSFSERSNSVRNKFNNSKSSPTEVHNTISHRMKNGKSRNQGYVKEIVGNLEDYLDKCTLHGLKYVGDTALSFGERVFWLVAFACAVTFAGYFISTLYVKFYKSPVIISFSPVDGTLDSFPFPAVTVCNMNQAVKKEAENIVKHGPEIHKRLLEDYCNLNNSFTNETTSTSWDTVFKFILKVSQPCSALLKECSWGQSPMNCAAIFNAELTDEGLCCSYNMLTPNMIFKNARYMDLLNKTFPEIKYDWTPEKGFEGGIPPEALPVRPLGPDYSTFCEFLGAGAHLGLTLVLDAQIDNYYCSSTNSVGFKLLLSNPIETPKMADFGFFLTAGKESRIVIVPEISEATATLKNIDVKKRKCYFNDERNLQFYRTYTERNCKLECQANHTEQKCGCVPYFLPKNMNTTICGRQEEECSDKAKAEMEDIHTNRFSCNCLPGCFELSFGKFGSYSKLSTKTKIHFQQSSYSSPDYNQANLAIVHFYFDRVNFKKTIKSELYGFTEFLSNTGGLLGLFLGFSFLSAVEIVYYLSLKLFCHFVRRKRLHKDEVFPFVK